MQRLVDAARFVRRLGTIAHRDELWTQLKDAAAPHGFKRLVVVKLSDNALTPLYSDAPAAVVAAVCDRRRPLAAKALSQMEPFAVAADASLGLGDAWIFPTRSGDVRGFVIIEGKALDVPSVVVSVLHLLAHLAFCKADDLVEALPSADHPLTVRELECLRWVARGKTDGEIAVILAISPRTARFHIENAKRKLGVAKRVHAVAEALRIRAIAA
jgi:DNA-binding CsgD family transcriptional regulator